MKALKVILGLVLVLVLAFVIAMFAVPTHVNVERSVVIDAPAAKVHPYVSNLRKMHEWSPWAEMDPDQKVEFIGEDGTVGSKQTWAGEKVGEGEQEITSITPNRVDSKLHFIKPHDSESTAYVNLEEVGENQTKVSWGFDADMPRPFNVMSLFMNMEEPFDKGLNKLKAMVEAAPDEKPYGGYDIQEVEVPATFFIMVKDTVAMADMGNVFGANFPKLFADAGAAGKQPGIPSGLYFTWDTVTQTTIMGVAIPVTPAGPVGKYDTLTVSGKALKIDYFGSYEGSEDAHNALGSYMMDKNLEYRGPVFEQYITDPETEPDTSKWHTAIYYPIQ